MHKIKSGTKYYKKYLAGATRSEVQVIECTSDSQGSTDISDTSEYYKPPQKKIEKTEANVYETICSSDMGESEEVISNDGQFKSDDKSDVQF